MDVLVLFIVKQIFIEANEQDFLNVGRSWGRLDGLSLTRAHLQDLGEHVQLVRDGNVRGSLLHVLIVIQIVPLAQNLLFELGLRSQMGLLHNQSVEHVGDVVFKGLHLRIFTKLLRDLTLSQFPALSPIRNKSLVLQQVLTKRESVLDGFTLEKLSE